MQMKALQNCSKTSKQIKSDMSDFSIINSRDKYTCILNHLNVLVLSQLSMYIYISCSSQIGFDIDTIDQKQVTQIETCDRVQYFLMLLINYILLYVLNKIEVFFFLKWLFFTMQADLRIVYLPDNGIRQGCKDFINVQWQYQQVHKYSIYVSPLKCSDVIRWIKHLISMSHSVSFKKVYRIYLCYEACMVIFI